MMHRLQRLSQLMERGVQRAERLLDSLPDLIAARLQGRAPRLAAAIRCVHIDSPLTTLFLAGATL